LGIPDGSFLHYQLDYKDLTRRTDEGTMAILCVVDAFSGYPIFIPISDMGGRTAGTVFIREIVTKRGQMLRVTTWTPAGTQYETALETYLPQSASSRYLLSSSPVSS